MNFETFLDILFPPECLACGKGLTAGTLCAACKDTIGGPPAIAIENMAIAGYGGCYFLGAAGRYKNHVLKTLIHALKFGGITGAARPLAELLAHHARTIALPLEIFTVMPIPLSKMRLRERGFNQSALIAEYFAHSLGLPFEKNILTRTQHRKPQSRTETLAERRENIRGCFAVKSNVIKNNAAADLNKNIILVDDVSTSGSTFREAARALSAAGAETILALAVARA
jgi:ComF family protein